MAGAECSRVLECAVGKYEREKGEREREENKNERDSFLNVVYVVCV